VALIYLSASLFSVAERDFNRRLGGALTKAGHEVILPQDFDQQGDQDDIFEKNTAAMRRADLILAVVDGPDVDSGVAWEMGFAYALNLPVAALRTDFRVRSETDGAAVNLMLHRGSDIYIEAMDDPIAASVEAVGRLLDSRNAQARS